MLDTGHVTQNYELFYFGSFCVIGVTSDKHPELSTN